MRKLYYAGGEMIVSDRTCKAILRYSRALALADKSDLVTVPIILEGSVEAFAHLLIGPASELFSLPIENSVEGPVDLEMVADFERRTQALQPSRPSWDQEMTDIPTIDELGLEYF